MIVVRLVQVFEHCIKRNLDVPDALEFVQIGF